ncbi:E4.3 [Barthadenovirus sternae]|nr:34K-2 [Tern adenovirus]UJZ92519.1 E4.3 [Tern atadenovirus 1]
MESNVKTASCQLGHRIFSFGYGFISKSMIVEKLQGLPLNICRLITNKLCDLPGAEGEFHCHCDEPMSLECISCRALLSDVCSSITQIPFKNIPFTYCCSQFKAFKTENRMFIICNSKNLEKVLFFIICECALKCFVFNVLHCNLNVIEIFVEHYKMECIVIMLNQRINLDCRERYGYHLGEYFGWKDMDAKLYGGRWCSVRFMDIRGMFQERAIKNYPVSPDVMFDYKFPPPVKSDDFWICFYAFLQCDCKQKCACADKYDTVKLNKVSIDKYVSGELRTPRALRNYILFYLSYFK